MTEQPTFVTFEADLLDDSEFSNSGEVSTPAGRGLSQVLTQALKLKGFRVPEWEQHKFYGWEATVELNGQKCWLLLQGDNPWLLIAERRSGFLGWMHRTEGSFRQLLTVIDAALKSDERLAHVSWFTRLEYENGNQVGNSAP